MPAKVNCTLFQNGLCNHQAAPRTMFGRSNCILWEQHDCRIERCALQHPVERPTITLVQPPPKSTNR